MGYLPPSNPVQYLYLKGHCHPTDPLLSGIWSRSIRSCWTSPTKFAKTSYREDRPVIQSMPASTRIHNTSTRMAKEVLWLQSWLGAPAHWTTSLGLLNHHRRKLECQAWTEMGRTLSHTPSIHNHTYQLKTLDGVILKTRIHRNCIRLYYPRETKHIDQSLYWLPWIVDDIRQ